MPEERSRAEIVFERYLNAHGVKWKYEALSGQRKPDYLIPHGSGTCIVEVKQIGDPSPRPTGGFAPQKSVRAKINRARKQFTEYKEFPCALLVYSESIYGPHDASVLLSAAFGPAFQRIGKDYTRLDPRPPAYRFLKRAELSEDRRFLANALFSPAANTTFSAIILLTNFRMRKLDLAVWKRLYAQQQAGEPIESQGDLLNELGLLMGQSLHIEETTRVITIENRHCRLPFPDDLFRGDFDQRWGWSGESCGPIWIGDRLVSLRDDESVPFHML